MRRILATSCVAALLLALAPTLAEAQQFGPTSQPEVDEHGHRPVGGGIERPAARPTSVDGDLPADWSLLGPPGGDVFDVAVSPVDPALVLAGTAPGGSFGGSLYRSTDGGDNWVAVPSMVGNSGYDIEFTPAGRVYLATISGLFDSDDGGRSWTRRDLGIGANQSVEDVTIDPADPATIWVTVGDAQGNQPVNLARSTDGGLSWVDRTPPLPAPMTGTGVAVDPTDPDTVIAVFGGAFGGGSVWVSTDGGDSWVNRSAGLPGNPMRVVDYDGSRLLVGGGQLFGSQAVGLYRSDDLGASWVALHDPSWPVLVVYGLAVDPSDPDTLLVATDGAGVHRTTDGGESWQIGAGGSGSLAGRSLRFSPGSSSELFLGTSSLAVFRSRDGGDSFASSANGIAELGLTSVAANPHAPAELAVSFEGQNDGGVLTSTDGGDSWTIEAAPPTRYGTVKFAPDGTLHAISTGPSSIAPEGLYRRQAGGGWVPLGPDQGTLFESELATVQFSTGDPELILLGGNDFGVAGSEATIWRSADGGASWIKTYEAGSVHSVRDIEIVVDGTDQQVAAVWSSSSGDNIGGALRSTDGGRSWSPSSTGLPSGFFREPRLCGTAGEPAVLHLSAWLGFDSGGVFRTTDAGQSWQSTGWTGARIEDVACDPVDDQLLYISQTGGAAVARSADQGATFTPYADGLEVVTAPDDLAFAGTTGLLLASRQGSFRTEVRDSGGPGDPVVCDETITGVHPGALTVSEGVTCLAAGAQVLGEVNVWEGAGLIATAAVIQGPVSAIGASTVELVFSQLTGPLLVTGASGVSLFGSQVTGAVALLGNAGPTVSGNTIVGTLSCFGNQPPPVDHGLPNTATGGKLGQCADL